MEQDTLTRISLACSVIGLIALGLVSSSVTANVVEVGSISPESIGILVRVCGNVSRAYTSKDGHVFLGLEDKSGSINVVVFENMVKGMSTNPTNLKVGDNICVKGEIDMYRNELEIIPKDIELIT